MASQLLDAPFVTAMDECSTVGPSVLLLDGNLKNLAIGSGILGSLGYTYLTAASAEEAFDHIARDPAIQVVIVDSAPIILDGETIIEEIRARFGASRAIACVLIADDITAGTLQRCLYLEVADVICKPLEASAVAMALRRAVKSAQQRQELLDKANLISFGSQLTQILSVLEKRSTLPTNDEGPTEETLAGTLRILIAARAMRSRHLSGQLFADPAWDIILDLTRAKFENQEVSVSSVCIAASVPMSTALRWVCQMTDSGLIRRWPDPKDRRRDLVALTDNTTANMKKYLHSVHVLMRK